MSSCRPAHALCLLLGTGPHSGPGPNDTATFNTMSGTSRSAAEVSGIVAQLSQADGPYTSSSDKGTGLADA